MNYKIKSNKGFSIIELMIGIFIFTLGLLSIYLIISGSLKLNQANRDRIIASNLSREGLELVKNMRDSNYKTLYSWKQIKGTTGEKFEAGKYYKVENNYSTDARFPIKMEKIDNFGEGKGELKGKMKDYKLCLDSENRYTYDCKPGNTDSRFYRYIKFDEVKYRDGEDKIIDSALRVTSKVIWNLKGYHEFEMKTIITDWQGL